MTDEPLLPVERLLFRGPVVKVGRFDCAPDHACFARTAPLHNDLFVLPRRPLRWRRGYGEFRFLEPGAAILHRAGREIERRACGTGGDLADWFAVRPDVFDETLCSHGLNPARITDRHVSCVTTPRFRLRLARLLTGLEAQAGSPPHRVRGGGSTAMAAARNGMPAEQSLEVEEVVLVLFDAVAAEFAGAHGAREPAGVVAARRRRRLVDRVRERISERPGSTEGLDQIARAAGGSVHHLCRVFRAECGLTVHEYRQRQRLGRALARMRRGRHDLTELALELGYSSHSHFSRVFRRYLGVSPSLLNGA